MAFQVGPTTEGELLCQYVIPHGPYIRLIYPYVNCHFPEQLRIWKTDQKPGTSNEFTVSGLGGGGGKPTALNPVDVDSAIACLGVGMGGSD